MADARSAGTLSKPDRSEGDDRAAILAALARIEARLDRVESLANSALAAGQSTFGLVVNSLDQKIAAAQARGVDVDARIHATLALFERITDPCVLDRLMKTLELFEQAPSIVATVVNTVDHTIGRMQQGGIDVDARMRNLVRALERLSSDDALTLLETTFERVEQLRAVLDSGILDPASVTVLSKVGQALVQTAAEPVDQVGLLGMVRAMSEHRLRTAAGFLVRFARRVGELLEQSAKQLPRTTRGAHE